MKDLTNYLKTSFTKSAVVDTGVVIDFLCGDKRAKAFFEEYVYSGKMTPVLSAQTVAELFMATRNKKEEGELDSWISRVFDIVETDYEISKEAGILKRSKGLKTGDCTPAASASVLNFPLVTTIPENYRRSEVRTFKAYS